MVAVAVVVVVIVIVVVQYDGKIESKIKVVKWVLDQWFSTWSIPPTCGTLLILRETF